MDRPRRKPNRLPHYDYSAPGAYFITICTREKRCILSDVVVGEGLAPPSLRLTDIGRIVEEQILALPQRFSGLAIEKYMIMPNHIHLLIRLSGESGGASPSPTVSTGVPAAIGAFKSLTTRLSGVRPLWQRSYYDHVVRNETEYKEIWEYITANPAHWAEDRSYP